MTVRWEAPVHFARVPYIRGFCGSQYRLVIHPINTDDGGAWGAGVWFRSTWHDWHNRFDSAEIAMAEAELELIRWHQMKMADVPELPEPV